jgi:hypothetical protein
MIPKSMSQTTIRDGQRFLAKVTLQARELNIVM